MQNGAKNFCIVRVFKLHRRRAIILRSCATISHVKGTFRSLLLFCAVIQLSESEPIVNPVKW